MPKTAEKAVKVLRDLRGAEAVRVVNEGMKAVPPSEASAKAFLIRSGIFNKSGKLAKPYR
jgi:hypothetical protein